MIRVRPDGITPLELWDLIVPQGGILWDHQQQPDFGEVLCGAIESFWQGAAVSRSDGPLALPRFDAVHLAGGLAEKVLPAIQRGPWRKVSMSEDRAFAGMAGGLAMLHERGQRGWVLDLGQSSLKLSNGDLRLSRERDWQALPLRVDGTIDRAQRQELRHWMARTLLEFRDASGAWPQALVAALPSRLDDAGVPEGSSYIGMSGDVNLLPDTLHEVGMQDIPLFVLNDAELAAASARVTQRIETTTLVLTIGFGVGGALITP